MPQNGFVSTTIRPTLQVIRVGFFGFICRGRRLSEFIFLENIIGGLENKSRNPQSWRQGQERRRSFIQKIKEGNGYKSKPSTPTALISVKEPLIYFFLEKKDLPGVDRQFPLKGGYLMPVQQHERRQLWRVQHILIAHFYPLATRSFFNPTFYVA